ncbi:MULTISPECIES: ABC transporter ATP-binding protein [Sphingomonadaceae]|uniref:ABC transporter ATP-binding protein n=1 Tax=Sphingomonadales TaxID=204457 RepID=UPI00077012A4|nr:ATP-binding cassette domain-containing protein [Sphingobium sp. TKS]AMK22986.1 ABC transporter ATP-binding protein [Sphingobium sp. TKS]MCF8706722.1 ATP-binding cassette domain-containing protein [Rhizorhapis sp. SPR117]
MSQEEGDLPLVHVKGLRTVFGEKVVHDGLDLDLKRGEILGVVGESGSGKSVLLNSILGLKRPDAGEISVLGHDVLDPNRQADVERRIGVMFQQGALFSALSVQENVEAPFLEHADLPIGFVRAMAALKIKLVGLPDHAGAQMPAELSGGMRKRASVARAIALDPELLFLDEPTSGLDPIGANAFDELVRALRDALGLTVFMITHDLDTLYTICDRVAVLADKRVIALASPREVEHSAHPWIKAYFGGPRGRAAREAH